MKKSTTAKIWFFVATCFMIVGIIDKNILCIILAFAYICFGCSNLSEKSPLKN